MGVPPKGGGGPGCFPLALGFVVDAVGRCRAENGYHGTQMVSNRVHRYDHYETRGKHLKTPYQTP